MHEKRGGNMIAYRVVVNTRTATEMLVLQAILQAFIMYFFRDPGVIFTEIAIFVFLAGKVVYVDMGSEGGEEEEEDEEISFVWQMHPLHMAACAA